MDEDLTRLWQLPTKTLGPALKGAFQTLWLASGCEPNHIVITAAWLGAACGAEPRTAWGWIQQLAEKGLLDMVDRDERRGSIQVYLYRPTAIMGPAAETAEDRQGLLPLSFDASQGVGGLRAQTPERTGKTHLISAHVRRRARSRDESRRDVSSRRRHVCDFRKARQGQAAGDGGRTCCRRGRSAPGRADVGPGRTAAGQGARPAS